jgi:hypothetical protein
VDAAWWWQLLLVAAAVHVGLELVVHLVVYPALARASTSSPEDARHAHEHHMHRMSLAVAPVYGLLAVASVGLVLTDPSGGSFLALGLVLATFAVTALAAVPAHAAIVEEPDPSVRAGLHRRLSRTDLVRVLLAVSLLAVTWFAQP